MPALPRMRSVKTLVGYALDGVDSRDWYDFASAQVDAASKRYNVDRYRMAALLALFSPRVHVKKSVMLAISYIETGRIPAMTLRSVAASIAHYELTGEIRGQKVLAFYQALLGDPNAIVLDTWMAKAFGIDERKDRWEYEYIAREGRRRIRKAARVLGWTPAQTQAAIWRGVMKEHGRAASFLLVEVDISEIPI